MVEMTAIYNYILLFNTQNNLRIPNWVAGIVLLALVASPSPSGKWEEGL